jgi:hypothetical protein
VGQHRNHQDDPGITVNHAQAELIKALEYEVSRAHDRDNVSRLTWAIGEINRLAEQQTRALQALRYLVPRLHQDAVELSLRATGTRVESDPLFQALKLQQEKALELYHELEKERA